MKYPVILADPPWAFPHWADTKDPSRRTESHYQTMQLDDIKALPVPSLMATDCVMFMWATWPMIEWAFDLGTAWGMTYRTCAFNWIKLNRTQTDKPFTGMGYWTRGNSEPCLLFARGAAKRQRRDVEQVVVDYVGGLFDLETETIATPIGAHSAKPDAIHERIERLVPGPYCELFARRPRPGWTVLGNEIDGRDINDAIQQEAEREPA